MHETGSANYIGYIDNFYEEGGNLRISGWIVPKHNKYEHEFAIRADSIIKFWSSNERQDVADFYGGDDRDYLNCGFDICIPTPKTNNITICGGYNGIREDLFTLSREQYRAEKIEPQFADEPVAIEINTSVPHIIVVDNFYKDPDAVRALALAQTFEPDLRYHKGRRTEKRFLPKGLKEVFESLIGKKIKNWTGHGYNGIFQYCTPEDPLVYHVDTQRYAAAIYLTDNAPVQTGTSFYKSKSTGLRKLRADDPLFNETFAGGFYDKTKFELVDTVGNVYNRLAIWDASMIHSASEYFGTQKDNSRLFHLFFFDIEE